MLAARTAVLMALATVFLMALPAAGAMPSTHAGMPHAAVAGWAAPSHTSVPSYGADTWTEYQHDSSNTGLSADTPVASNLNWNSTLPNFQDPLTANGAAAPAFISSPVVGQGNVYFAAGDDIIAYNATSGAVVWNTTLDRGVTGVPVVVTPALWRGMLFLVQEQDGGTFPPCAGGAAAGCSSIYALNATNGTIMQSIQQTNGQWGGGASANSPVPIYGADFGGNAGILITDIYGYQYAYTWSGTALTFYGSNAGARAGGTRTTSTPSIALLPGIGPGGSSVWSTFYLDSAGGGGHQTVRGYQYTLATETNTPGYPSANGIGPGQTMTWATTNSGSIAVTNVSAGGTTSWPYGFFGDDAGPGAASHLIAMNLTAHNYPSFALLQTTNPATDCGLLSTPAVVSNWGTGAGLLVTDMNGTVSRWNFTTSARGGTLTQMWNHTLGGTPVGSPAVAGDVAYVADSAGNLYAISVNTGNVEWTTTLSAPVRSDGALAYSRLFEVSDPIGGGTTGNVTAFGPTPGPAVNHLTLTTTANPATITAGGAPSMLVAHTTWVASRGGATGPAVGAWVNFTVAPNVGTFDTVAAIANANGYAYANWTAPSYSPVWYNVTVTTTAQAPRNLSATPTATQVTVKAGGTTGGGGLLPLAVAITPATSSIASGAIQPLSIYVAKPSAAGPATGAAVALTVSGLGSVSPTTASVGANGYAYANFTAPGGNTVSTASLVTASATLTGFLGGSASAAVTTQAPPTQAGPGNYTMSLTVSPLSSAVWPGNVTQLVVTVTNASNAGAPQSGIQVTAAELSAPSAGSFDFASRTSNGAGKVFFNYTTGTTTGAVLLSFSVPAVPAKHLLTSSVTASVSIFAKSSTTTPPAQTPTSQNNGLRTIDWALIGLVIVLLIALLAALVFGRRRKESPAVMTGAATGGAAAGAAADTPAAERSDTSEPEPEPAPVESTPAEEPASTTPSEGASEPEPSAEDTSPIKVDEPASGSSEGAGSSGSPSEGTGGSSEPSPASDASPSGESS